MNVCHTLMCIFLLSALRDTGVIRAEILTETEGGNITVECSFGFSGSKKLFCRDECEDGNVLIETEEDTAQSGRYSIKYEKRRFFQSDSLYVTITKLKKSDSGRYRCHLDDSWSSDFLFEIRVKDAATSSEPNWTLQVFSTSIQSASAPTTSASPEGPERPNTPPAAPGVMLYVRLTLVVVSIVASATALMICRKRARKLKEPPVETESGNVTGTNRASEESREGGQTEQISCRNFYSGLWVEGTSDSSHDGDSSPHLYATVTCHL